MKKLITILVILFVFSSVFSQVPEQMSYQAVARDLSGYPLVNTAVDLRFDIIQGTASGTVTYSETQSKTTNKFGLFTAEIGKGTVISGSFPGIAWGANPYFLKITVNGDEMPATQLLSVPYALYSKTSGGAGSGLVAGPGIDIAGGVVTATSDTSQINEIQVLSISNDTIFLSNGGFIELPSTSSDTDWVVGTGFIYNQNSNVGIGTGTPNVKLAVVSSDSVITSLVGLNPFYSALAISNTPLNPSAGVGVILLAGSDTGVVGLNPVDKQLAISNSTTGGHLSLVADSSVVSYGIVVGQNAKKILEKADTIISFGKTTNNVININQGTFFTDSLYKLGNNSGNVNWVLANKGFGKAVWTDPLTLPSSSGLWQSNTPDISFNTGNVGVGTSAPTVKLDVAGEVNTSDFYRIDGSIFLDNKSTSTLVGATGNTSLTGVGNTFVGITSGQNSTTGSDNTFIGNAAGNTNVGGGENVAIGSNSLLLNTIGWSNVAVGYKSLNNNNTSGNTAIGYRSMQGNTTGIQNAALGLLSLSSNVTGNRNTAIGNGALEVTLAGNNTGLGYNAGSFNITGINNTFIGHNANVLAGQTNLTNATAIGSNATVNTSNSLILGNNANVGIGTSSPSSTLDVVGFFQYEAASGNSTDAVLTSVDANGNAEWRAPERFAANSSSTGINTTNLTPIIFNTEDYDIGGGYDNTTGIFTSAKGGYYHVDAAVMIDASSTYDLQLQLLRNGGTYRISYVSVNASDTYAFVTISADVYLPPANNISIGVYHTAGGTLTPVTGASSSRVYFNAHLIR